ncbi:hypothetical protein PLICRDRAFT_578361 [Plicaturopsis crispa FD-325 SS-3]|nr:hypothetical protein PLICRDRAFT_578361 [Plicaturopsis crispa FD-325 SS-3]
MAESPRSRGTCSPKFLESRPMYPRKTSVLVHTRCARGRGYNPPDVYMTYCGRLLYKQRQAATRSQEDVNGLSRAGSCSQMGYHMFHRRFNGICCAFGPKRHQRTRPPCVAACCYRSERPLRLAVQLSDRSQRVLYLGPYPQIHQRMFSSLDECVGWLVESSAGLRFYLPLS